MGLNLGQKLKNGKYVIDRELGRGRFGITYLAKDADGAFWVIKILNPAVLACLNEEECDRLEEQFWQEGTKLARCHGTPHIVQAEMPFKEGTIVCLPMEYVDGVSLADRAERILLEETALEYIRQIGEALAVVHGQGLIHCDIRPANILLRIRGSQAEAVLIDFGLALTCDAELTRTREKERVDGFSPIELYSRGQAVGSYTDIYSLAATLYELLTGETPESAYELRSQSRNIVSPQVKNLNISAQTAKAILTGMALEAEKRSQSIQAWLKLLQLKKIPSGSLQIDKTNWTKWQTIWGAIAVAVAIVVGIPAWLAALKPNPQPSTKSVPQANPPNILKKQVSPK